MIEDVQFDSYTLKTSFLVQNLDFLTWKTTQNRQKSPNLKQNNK